MPRGHKHKGHSCAEHHQARRDSQGHKSDHPTSGRGSTSLPVSQSNSPSFSGASTPQGSLFLPSPDADTSSTGSGLGAEASAGSGDAESLCTPSCSFQVEPTTQPICKDALTKEASMLVDFLLEKFQKSEHFTDADMRKVVNKKYKKRFSDILRKSSSRMEMIFGMQLKKINTSNQTYAIVSKLGLSTDEILSGKRGLPKMGLLMTILGLIFANGNCVTEEEIWKFLRVLGVYAGKKHLIFGEPRRLITRDLVEQNYLEIRKISEGKSPRYDFLWGPRAYIEASKMKVLEVWAKINDTTPSFFPALYEEALKEQMERAELESLGPTAAMDRVHPRCMSCSFSHK
ncbi:melanoma-associated antigen B4-like [Mastomys coucha]|uniref:melanoma-associated antigen B4-like n=1 Tax=Mastomys coucha TaxID=35658 RepID=UPI0012622564|nr:melanoma-associated antigen B4-like [Mastomys coucha]XP_031230947.1 melanoma-associated antigen B4-like [Mastomys coucha]